MPPSVIVIGAGVVGSAIAWELAAAGAEVRILEARRPGEGASRASAGILAPFIEGHSGSPLQDLGRASLDLYDGFVQRLARESGRQVVYERHGTLEVALTDEEAESLAAASAALWRLGVEARWVPREVVPDLEPQVSKAAVGALLVPAHGYVGVGSLTAAAVAAAEARGARLVVDTGAVEVRPLPDDRVSVRTATGAWDADAAVLAAGSWSSVVAVHDADPVPVRPIRGQLLQMRAPRGMLRRIIWGKAGYLVPWPDGQVLVGATVEDVGFDESTTEGGRRHLVDAAAMLVPALRGAGIVDVRAGLRPRAPDDLPIVGRSRAVRGLVYATAHYRNGVLLAPLTAEIVRGLVLDRASSGPAALDPARCGNL